MIIDEQHKFGVAQREQLVRKGHYPHLLVMTATPIPRTLGLTLYGELDVSVIDELPPGRGSIKTFVRAADKLPQVWAFIRGKLAEGRQAYVVYPRVEETGPDGVKAVTKEFENLQQTLAPFRVGLLHGRLRSKEKEDVMDAFRAREAQVLLATSLIEVGVDVPNATIMLIENAELFGLAQLHQLRGRIGRGAHDSYCILVAAAKSKEARHALAGAGRNDRWLPYRRGGPEAAGPWRVAWPAAKRDAQVSVWGLGADLELIQQARQLAAQLQVEASNCPIEVSTAIARLLKAEGVVFLAVLGQVVERIGAFEDHGSGSSNTVPRNGITSRQPKRQHVNSTAVRTRTKIVRAQDDLEEKIDDETARIAREQAQ